MGRNVQVSGAATIKAVLAVNAVPVPPSFGMLASALVVLMGLRPGISGAARRFRH